MIYKETLFNFVKVMFKAMTIVQHQTDGHKVDRQANASATSKERQADTFDKSLLLLQYIYIVSIFTEC